MATLSLCALLALPGPAEASDAAAERVDRYLARIETLRADFRQKIIDSSGSLRDEASGTLAVAKPGRFRWDYHSPGEQVLVSDGTTLWLYDVDLEQVTVRKAGETLSATPASLLSGGGKASEAFDIRDAGVADGIEWVDLTPRLQDTDFRQVRLGFRQGTPACMELVDRLGQTTRIDFTAVEVNPALPVALFAFEIPEGVDVLGSPGSR